MGIKWPRYLTPSQLSQLIRQQKNPLTALRLFNTAKSKYPSYHHNTPVYATMIESLAASGHLTEMKHVISQMTRDSCQCTDSVFAGAIRTYANAGRPDEAVALFHQIPHSNCVAWTRSFNSVLRILADQGDLDACLRVFVGNCASFEVTSLNILIEALCRIGRSDLALEVFGEIKEHCCYPDRETYRILMRGLCEEGRLEDGTHLLYSMLWRISQKGCQADVIVYRMLLEALCAKGRVGEAEEILGKVLRKGLRTPRGRRGFRGWEISGGGLEEMKISINEALVKGGARSLAGYGAMIADLYSEGRIGDADRLFDEMLKSGFRPSVATIEAKIAALCEEGRAEEGGRVLEKEMPEIGCVPRVQTYNMVMEGLCKEGKSTRAVFYLEKMGKQKGCVPSKETYEILVGGLCCEGRFIEASRVLDMMLNRSLFPGNCIFNGLIRGLCSLGRRYEALLWLEEMVSQGKTPEVSLWNSLVSMICINTEETSVLTCINVFASHVIQMVKYKLYLNCAHKDYSNGVGEMQKNSTEEVPVKSEINRLEETNGNASFSNDETVLSSNREEQAFLVDDYICSLCCIELPPSFIEERQEHLDYHFAVMLQEETMNNSSGPIRKERYN